MAGGSRFRFELTRLEVVGVIVSSAASLFIVFLLGVYTGGGLGARRLADEERVVRLPVAPAAEDAAESEPALDEMLAGNERPATAGGGATLAAHPSAGADAHARAGAASAPVPPRAPEARVAVALAANPAPSPAVQHGAWSVQVTATLDPRTADDMLRRLRAKGYDAYVVKAARQGKTYYRVRVGHFRSAEHAGQMVSRLRREPGVPEAFVASD